MTLNPSDLLTVAGAAAATLLLIQLLVKPALKAHPVSDAAYPLVINLVAIALSGVFVALGMFALGNVTNTAIVQGVLTTLLASATAIGAANMGSNTQKFLSARKK